MKIKILISTVLLFGVGTFVFAGENPFARKNLRWNSRSSSVKTEESIEKSQETLSEEEINAIIDHKLQKRLVEIEKENAKVKKEAESTKELGKIGPAPAPRQNLSGDQIEKIVDNRIEEKNKAQKAEEERNNGWYFSFGGQYALAEDKVWGEEEMNMYGLNFVIGKELDNSIFDIAGMFTLMGGDLHASRFSDDYYVTINDNLDYVQYDVFAGLRFGISLEPASWITLKCGVMGGVDVRYGLVDYYSFGYYYSDYYDEDLAGVGYYYGAYASVRFNFSTHWSLFVEGSMLMSEAELEGSSVVEDIGIEKSLGYTAISAGLTYRW